MAAVVGGVAYLVTAGGSSDPAPTREAGSAEIAAVVYRSPTCGCCESYVEYLRRHGVTVRDEVTDDVASVKAEHGLPEDAESCHTSEIEGYVVEGHVPLEAIDRLLEERPDVDGIAVPGMPTNSPGMGEPNGEPLEVVAVDDGHIEPFVTL